MISPALRVSASPEQVTKQYEEVHGDERRGGSNRFGYKSLLTGRLVRRPPYPDPMVDEPNDA